jgi:hypothetical protein
MHSRVLLAGTPCHCLSNALSYCLPLQDDSSWAQGTGSKQQLVSDLVEMLAVGLPPASSAPAPPLPAALAAAAASGDPVATAAANGAWILAPQQLVAAARQLLALLLELYSCCEAVGLYSSATGRSRAAAGRQNDRYYMDAVIMDSLMGDLHGEHMLDACKQPQGLRRLLQALPAPHLSRLLSAVVASECRELGDVKLGVLKDGQGGRRCVACKPLTNPGHVPVSTPCIPRVVRARVCRPQHLSASRTAGS